MIKKMTAEMKTEKNKLMKSKSSNSSKMMSKWDKK